MKRLFAILAVSAFFIQATFAFAQILVEEVVADEPDTSPPEIVSFAAVSHEPDSAVIEWTTDEVSYGRVEYGPTGSYGFSTETNSMSSLMHVRAISGLSPGTSYHYRICVKDESGNEQCSADLLFETAQEPEIADEDPPSISGINVSNITVSGATISFVADELVVAKIEYGKTLSYGFSTGLSEEYADSHSFTLSNLEAGTLYHYKIIAEDESGNIGEVSNKDFSTLEPEAAPEPQPEPEEVSEPTPAPEPTPEPEPTPKILNVKIDSVSFSGATISWATNINTKSKVEYGFSTSYGKATPVSAFLLSHSVSLSALSSGKLYNFRIISRDSLGNTALSKNYTFSTAEAPGQTVPDSISKPAPAPALVPQPQPLPITGLQFGGPALIPTPPSSPILVKTEGLDSQVSFLWLRDFNEKPNISIRIIRKLGSPVKSREDGEVVFDGNGKSFTDTNVENGVTYHYGLFSYDRSGRSSQMKKLAVTPNAQKDQIIFDSVPDASPQLPVFSFPNNIFPQTSGKSVEHMQALLARFPKIYPEGLVTGYYGELTAKAIKTFQQKYNLPQTGFVGAQTRKKLEELSMVPQIYANKSSSQFSRGLKQGLRGSDVSLLQEFLSNEGHYGEEITGYFGPVTKNALVNFQKEHSIEPSAGYFGPLTRAKIHLIKKSLVLGF